MTPARIKSLRRLEKLLPGEIVLDPATLAKYAGDKWFATHPPDAVALPRSAQSVSKILRFADQNRIPVTPRGAGHGYVGGCVPVRGGIVLSLERLNRLLEINRRDFVAVVQPAVVTEQFQKAVEKRGLFYPPDPASRADNFIGGNLATNAGRAALFEIWCYPGLRAGLEVVLANGDIVRLGGRTHKNKTGFDLHRLFIGSEGLLGVITEATLKLIPLPPFRANLAVGFASMKNAVRALQAILASGFLPCALELAEQFTLAAAAKRTRSERLLGCRAHLIVELDGQENSVRGEIKELEKIIATHAPLFVDTGYGRGAVRGDLENPPGIFLRPARHRADEIERGHRGAARTAGGFVPVHRPAPEKARPAHRVLRPRRRRQHPHQCNGGLYENWREERSGAALDELFRQVIAWGGAISGEHGIGLAKLRWWPQAVSPESHALHRTIKQALDPHGILNPGKFVRV